MDIGDVVRDHSKGLPLKMSYPEILYNTPILTLSKLTVAFIEKPDKVRLHCIWIREPANFICLRTEMCEKIRQKEFVYIFRRALRSFYHLNATYMIIFSYFSCVHVSTSYFIPRIQRESSPAEKKRKETNISVLH